MADLFIASRYAAAKDSDFTLGAARAIWTDQWLEQNENALPPGARIDDFVPETPVRALKQARQFEQALLTKNGAATLNDVLNLWQQAWKPDADRPYSPVCAGWYAAMEAMGHGVGLFLFDIDADLPHLN